MEPVDDRCIGLNALSSRLSGTAVKALGKLAADDAAVAETLFAAIGADDDRVGYNALWALTHAARACRKLLSERRDMMIDRLLTEKHTGRRRLLLSLLETSDSDGVPFRGDYFDFCMERINSAEPYGIRALCLKQAAATCRRYPALTAELRAQVAIMGCGHLSPGLKAVLRKINRSPLCQI